MSTHPPEANLHAFVRSTPVSDALVRLYRERATGRLSLTLPGGGHGEVIVREGCPIALAGSIEDARRGAWLRRLVEAGLLDQELARGVLSKGRVPWVEALSDVPPESRGPVFSVLTLWQLEAALEYAHCETQFSQDLTCARIPMAFAMHPMSLLECPPPESDLPDTGRIFALDPESGVEGLPRRWAALAEVAARALGGLNGQLEAVARAMEVSRPQAAAALLTLWRGGHLTYGYPQAPPPPPAPDGPVERLGKQDYFARLSLPREADGDAVRAAHAAAVKGIPAQDPHREQLQGLYDQALRGLIDDERRAIYVEALDIGEDPNDSAVIDRLTVRYVAGEGRRLLEDGDYEQAALAFSRLVKLVPDDAMAHVNYAWSAFLASGRDEEAADKAAKRMRRATEAAPEMDTPLLFLGKIYRLAGAAAKAEAALKQAMSLNPRNPEIRSELRLVSSRAQRRGRSSVSVSPAKKAGGRGKAPSRPGRRRGKVPATDPSLLPPAIGIYLGVCLLLFVGANLIPGGGTHEPMANTPWPEDLRRLGNMEYFYVFGDPWWWIRRVVIGAAGVLGLRWLHGKGMAPKVIGEDHRWLAGALIYGLAVGYFTPVQQIAGGIGALLMTFVHVAAEQAFFIGFLHTALSRGLKRPEAAVAGVAAMFGLYQLTYMATFRGDPLQVLIEVLQIGLFAGGAYAALAWRYGAMGGSILAHLVVNTTMMIHALMSRGG